MIMAKRKVSNTQLGIFAIILIVGTFMYGGQVADLLGINVDDPFKPVPTVEGQAPHTFTLYKRGTSTVVETADVYGWYDWNGNGLVDLGTYPEGEIEELASAATTGVVTTSLNYPIGESVLYQVHKTGYEVETFSRVVNYLPNAHDGSALPAGDIRLTLTGDGVTSMRIGDVTCVTASGDYNVTAEGGEDEPMVEVYFKSNVTDSGINEKAFTHWGTGKDYAGTFMGLTVTQADFPLLGISGYDGIFTDGTDYFIWFYVDGYFDDAAVTNDQRFSVFFDLDISAALSESDFDIIGFYNGVEKDDVAIGQWNTVLGESETDIDVTQV